MKRKSREVSRSTTDYRPLSFCVCSAPNLSLSLALCYMVLGRTRSFLPLAKNDNLSFTTHYYFVSFIHHYHISTQTTASRHQPEFPAKWTDPSTLCNIQKAVRTVQKLKKLEKTESLNEQQQKTYIVLKITSNTHSAIWPVKRHLVVLTHVLTRPFFAHRAEPNFTIPASSPKSTRHPGAPQ